MTRISGMFAGCLAAVFAAVAAAKGGPGDYARQWPVQADGDGAYAVVLTPDVYAHIARGDLSDLAAFNADGEPLAFGPMPPSLVHPAARWRETPWFALPTATSRAAGDLHIHATRDAQGVLAFDATVVGTATDDAHPDLLIDVQPGQEAIDQVEVVLLPDAGVVNAQLRIEASADLQHWDTLVPEATVARLEQGGAVLERRLVELPPTTAPYLRLRSIEGSKPLPLASVRVRVQPAAPERRQPPEQWLEAKFVKQEQRAWFYALPARVPVEQLDIDLGADNAIDELAISSRTGPDATYWNSRGSLTAFRLRGGGVELDNAPLRLDGVRDREWRLDARTDLAKAPTVKFAFHPETFLLLTHGRPPYVIAAGSAKARRADYPLEALFAQVRARQGREWEPPVAALGAMQVAGGDAVLHAPPPDETKQHVLWAVLGLGALLVIGMVFKLLREPGRTE